MGKALTLLLTILLAVASGAGYLFLDEKIAAGQRQVVDGQAQLEEGRSTLEEGEAELEAGKQDLAAAEEGYEAVENLPFLEDLDEDLQGEGSEEIERQFDEGDAQVARGEERVAAGQERLEAGELELRRGQEQLSTAKSIRVALALGAVVFALLSIVLGFRWRRSLARTLMRTDA